MPRRNNRQRTFGNRATVPDPIAGCEGKTAYPGPDSAARALKQINKRRKTKPGARVYRCGVCSEYHIGRS